MEFKYFDAHTHAHFAAYKQDWQDVIQRALDAGVQIINVGTQQDTSSQALEVAASFESGVYAAIGLHPVHTTKSFHDANELGGGEAAKGFTSRGEQFDSEFYLRLAQNPLTLAIGECGLDYFRPEGNLEDIKEKQRVAFEAQIDLAYEVKKPLMIHCREAFGDLIKILKSKKSHLNASPGVIHFFSGSVEDARELLDLGFGFTFGGVITFARDYDQVISIIPSERILSETDAPYVTPVPHRGKRNEPAYVRYVVQKLAELKGLEEPEMAETIMANSMRIFGLKSKS